MVWRHVSVSLRVHLIEIQMLFDWRRVQSDRSNPVRHRRPSEFTPDNSFRLSFKRRNAGRTTVEFSIKNDFLIRTFGHFEYANYMCIRAIFFDPTDSSHNIPIVVPCVRMCHTAPLFSSIITSIKIKKLLHYSMPLSANRVTVTFILF